MSESVSVPASRRLVAGIVLPVAIVAVSVVPWILVWSRLPDPVATHWGLGETPNGHQSAGAAAALMIIPALVAAVVVAAVARRPATAVSPRAAMGAVVAAGLGGLFAIMSVSVALANAGAATWHDASLNGLWVLASIAAGLLTAAAAARSLGPAAGVLASGPAERPAGVPVAAGERVAWVGACHARWPLWTAAAAAAGAGIALFAALWLAATLALVAVAVALVGTVHVTVGEGGVRAAAAPGWPAVSFPLSRIEAARAIDLQPMRWGGWGYRGSVRVAGRAAWVLRAGEALELRLAGGKMFAVTVDGATEAAAVVNGLLDRAACTPG